MEVVADAVGDNGMSRIVAALEAENKSAISGSIRCHPKARLQAPRRGEGSGVRKRDRYPLVTRSGISLAQLQEADMGDSGVIRT